MALISLRLNILHTLSETIKRLRTSRFGMTCRYCRCLIYVKFLISRNVLAPFEMSYRHPKCLITDHEWFSDGGIPWRRIHAGNIRIKAFSFECITLKAKEHYYSINACKCRALRLRIFEKIHRTIFFVLCKLNHSGSSRIYGKSSIGCIVFDVKVYCCLKHRINLYKK